jgi:hypothetical protein
MSNKRMLWVALAFFAVALAVTGISADVGTALGFVSFVLAGVAWYRIRREKRVREAAENVKVTVSVRSTAQSSEEEFAGAHMAAHVASAPKAEGDDWDTIETHVPAPFVSQPEVGLPEGHPFSNREYVTLVSQRRDRVTGRVYSEQRTYCADEDALQGVCRCVSLLEFMVEQAALPLKSVPPLKTDFRKLRAARSTDTADSLRGNVPRLVINPLTPTGRTPKYPTRFVFATERDSVEESSTNAEVDFLPDGSLGKARLVYWCGRVGYRAWFKLFGDRFDLSLLEHVDRDGTLTEVYRAE